ncbi:MAG: ketopantoate reductase family protein [Deltaproteobacteria bacterium]|nr:ketopantoate reductase family protein [Deltaproteobacteria bacterium]MBW1942414.1 ketopantoate reductase family protein [Deltaproteobacteria bacterium]MBW2205584.1 ketopantoate reductase family protein [Deltaproteobacteria bacterium]
MIAPIKRIAVIGAGAMGSAYAEKIYAMDGESIFFIAAGERYDRLKRSGVVVNGKHCPIAVIKPEDIQTPFDLLIVAVKHHHLPEAIKDMKQGIGENTCILSVMNGIESEEQIAEVYGKDRVLYAVAVGIDALREGNRLTYSTPGKLFFGEADNHVPSGRVKDLQDFFDGAGIPWQTPDDMVRILWWKFMVNVGMNPVSVLMRANYGVFQTSGETRALMGAAMKEVIALAEAARVNLSEKDIEDWYTVMEGLSPHGKTSMLQDIEAGRKTEIEMLGGKVTELGRRYGIPTPVNEALLTIIKVLERHAMPYLK